MSDHEIVYEHDRDMVTSRAVCNVGTDALCHQVCERDCEEWSGVELGPDGWRHLYYDGTADAEVWHAMKSVDYCNVVLYLEDSPLDEVGPHETFEVGRIGIKPVWMGEGYDWERDL